MRDRIGSWWIVAAVVVATCGLSQSRAQAQLTTGEYGGLVVAGGVAGSLLAIGQLAFAVGDIVSWTRDTPFSDGWAAFELIYSGVISLTDLVLVIWIGAAVPDPGPVVGTGLAPLLLGGINIAHAIWSLGNLSRDPPQVAMSIVPTQGGVLVSGGGHF